MSKPRVRYRLRLHFCLFVNGKRRFDVNIPIGKVTKRVEKART